MLSRLSALLLAATLLLPTLPANAVGDNYPVEFNGSGWGHGVGLSQWGAYGMATKGRTYSQILRHYYRGTSVVGLASSNPPNWLSNTKPLWIGLRQSQAGVQFKMIGGAGKICHAGDCSLKRNPGKGQLWRFVYKPGKGGCVFERLSPNPWQGKARACDGSIKPGKAARIEVVQEDNRYKNGLVRLRAVPGNGNRFHVSFQTSVQRYLRGIAEVFSWWPQAAIRAQVIASRSYALSNASARGPESSFSSGVKQTCWCHLYDDTRSQVFSGIIPGFGTWKNAVAATNGKVVAHNGSIITAFYSSSSGGRTENVEDVWGGTPRPWLVSVNDKWAHPPINHDNPLSSWSRVRTAGSIANAVGLGTLERITVNKRPSGGVATVTFHGPSQSVTRSGTWVQSAFDLPSHYFSVPPVIPRFCNGQAVTKKGNYGANTINGTAGRDVIHAGPGNDTIEGRGGNDVICGGDGADRIRGAGGNDKIHGGSGADRIWGGTSSDVLKGAGGRDRIWGKGGPDTLYGGRGNDILRGGNGVDTLRGGFGSDSCYYGKKFSC